jgi:hypothetical protein
MNSVLLRATEKNKKKGKERVSGLESILKLISG